MSLIPHTPDPTDGALVDAANAIIVPDDNQPMQAAIGRAPAEQLADWIAFLKVTFGLRGIRTLTSGPATETVYYTDATCLGPAAPTSDIVAEMDKVGVPSGARLRVGRKDAGMSSRTLVVKNGVGGSTVATIGIGDIGWMEAEFKSSNWIVTAWGGTVTVV